MGSKQAEKGRCVRRIVLEIEVPPIFDLATEAKIDEAVGQMEEIIASVVTRRLRQRKMCHACTARVWGD